MKDWPAGQAQGGPTLPKPPTDLTRLVSGLSRSPSLPTLSPTFPYEPASASSRVLQKSDSLSDELVLAGTWTSSQTTVSPMQKLLDSLVVSFYRPTSLPPLLQGAISTRCLLHCLTKSL